MAYPPIDPKVLAFLAEQEKRRKAIVVNAPNDPRLRAYQDSTNLYNAGQQEKRDALMSKTAREFDSMSNIYGQNTTGRNAYENLKQTNGVSPNRNPQIVNFPDGKATISTWTKPQQPVELVRPINRLSGDNTEKWTTVAKRPGFHLKENFETVKAPPARNNDTTRPDGTQKGRGFFGEVKRPDGKVSTELSIGVNIGGKEVLIPTMVPGLTNQEIDHLLSGKYNPQARQGVDDVISRKAIDFAKQRIAKKQPFFATPQEEGKFKPAPIPAPSPIQPRLAPTNISQPLPQTQPALIPAVIRPTQEPMAQPPPHGKPIETWGPGQRYSLKDEKVRQMLKVIERLKK